MNRDIYFKTILNLEEFLNLQNSFLARDIHQRHLHDELAEPQSRELSIVEEIYNEINENVEYIELKFYEDFFYSAVNQMAKRYISFFKRKVSEILDHQKSVVLAKEQHHKFFEINEIIKDLGYLPYKAKYKLSIQINIIQEYLSDASILDNYQEADKIKLDIGKHEFLTLIILLKNGGILASDLDAKLGHLIDRYFLFKNGENFHSFRKSGKLINDIRNGNRIVDQALERLKNRLQDDDFCNLPLPGQ